MRPLAGARALWGPPGVSSVSESALESPAVSPEGA